MDKLFNFDDQTSRNNITKRNLLRLLVNNGDSTIADLCDQLHLSPPTVAKLIGELIEDEYVNEFGKQDTPGGRKPSLYGLNPSSGCFVGVEVNVESITLAAVDFKGTLFAYEDVDGVQIKNDEESFDLLCKTIDDFIERLDFPRTKVRTVGVNLSGRVNPFTGYCYSLFYYGENPLDKRIEKRLGIKTYIENDTRAMTYGEYMCGVVKGEKNVLFVNLSWGLGMGMIMDGKIYYGKSGFAGEIGHFAIFENEILCHCGKKGCLETEASGIALHRKLTEAIKKGSMSVLSKKVEQGEPITFHNILDAIRKEDVLTLEFLDEIGARLGQSIAWMINLFNPELVVLGGVLSSAGDYIRLPVQTAVKKYSLNMVSNDTEIRTSRLGMRAGVIGACMLSRSKLLGMIGE